MWAVIWRVAVFALGLLWLRGALYSKRWGHGGPFVAGIQGVLGVALCAPLWIYAPAARVWLAAGAGLLLLPWKQMALLLMERRIRKGLQAFAVEWGTEVEEESEGELVRVVRPGADGVRKAWVGNVLTHVRSLHPGVSTQQTYRMLAFVVRLDEPPAFRCALTKGWSEPTYHEKEWRENTTMQGQMFAMSMGDLLTEGARETGGSVEELTEEPALEDERFEPFYTVRCDDAEAFARTFSGDLLEEFFGCAFQAVQFECNVTPTSVNAYSIYMGEKEQRRNLDFLDRLADAVATGDEAPGVDD